MTENHATGHDKALLEALLGTMNEAVVTATGQGVIQRFNPAAERLFGYSAAEVIGHGISLLMPAPYSNDHPAYLQDYLKTGVSSVVGKTRQVQGLTKSGAILQLEITISALQGAETTFCAVLHEYAQPVSKGPQGETAKPQQDAASQEWVDLEALEELAESAGREMILELTASFLAETAERCKVIQTADDLDEVGYQSHTLKSSCGTFGAKQLAQRAFDLDMAYKNQDWQSLQSLRADIVRLYEKTAPHLEGLAQQLAG